MNPLKTMTEQFGLGRSSSAATPPSLTLIFSDRKIGCFVWGNESGRPQIYSGIASGDWGGVTLEELVVSADGVVSSAFNQVSNRFVSPPTQVVLAVPFSWVNQSGLTTEKSLLLANLTRKLGLTASGYIVVPEAIATHIKDSLAVTGCLFMQIEENDMYLTLIRQSKVVDSIKISRSDDITSDLEEGMVRLQSDQPYPSVVYLSGNLDLIETKQKLTNYPLPDSGRNDRLGFLQLPKFEITPPDFEAKAIISQVTGNVPLETIVDTLPVTEPPVREDDNLVLKSDVDAELTEAAISDPVLEPAALGFSKNSDIVIYTPSRQPSQPPVLPTTVVSQIDTTASQIELEPSMSLNPDDHIIRSSRIPPVISALFRRLSARTIGLTAAPIAILLLLTVGYWLTASADVRLIVNSQKQPQKFNVLFSDKTNQIDAEKLILPVTTAQVELTGSGTTDVQGSKEVGDKAKGEVTIYNGTAVTKSLAKGSSVKSTSGLKFTLDDAVVVPAKSTDLSVSPPVDKWGEKKVLVTAADIGTEYNLAANSTFNFDTTATSSAWLIKNQNAFVAGSSRQVQAVDASDKDRLSKEVLADLTNQAGGKIEEKTKNDNGKLLTGTIKVKSKTERFDKAVGDESETLRLESTTVFTGLYYKTGDLYDLINAKLKSLIPAGYQQKPTLNDPVISVVNQKENLYQVEIQAEYIPEVDLISLSQQLKGKPVLGGETIIKSITGVTGYEVDLSPFPFSLLKRFPLKSEKITITLVAK